MNDPGLAAVRIKFGPAMESHFENWPRLAWNYAEAQYNDQQGCREAMEKAEANLSKARGDKDYALDQAERIARAVPKREWDLVPSVAQLRRDWAI